MTPEVVPRVIHTVWDAELDADRLQQASPKPPARMAHLPRMVPWWNKEVSQLKASTRRLFNQAYGQVTGNHITQPAPIITKRVERPNSHLGGTTVKGWKMHLTGPDSWPNGEPTGWNLLN